MDEEEVPYQEEAVEEEVPEEEEEVLVPPEPPPLKRSSKAKLQDRVECGDCHRQVSRHTLLHTHRCPAKKKREAEEAAAEAPAPAPAPAPKKRAKAEPKPAMPQAEVQKPLKQRAVMKKAEKARAEQPMPEYGAAFEAAPQDLWSQLMNQRALQSRMRAEAAASPYAQMFAQQRSSRVL